MRIEFDAPKDRANRAKHDGLSLSVASELDWNAMQVKLDDAEYYGEDRWIGVAPKDDRLYTLVFTVRGADTMRIISLRRATNQEIGWYEETVSKQATVPAQHRSRGSAHSRRHKRRR